MDMLSSMDDEVEMVKSDIRRHYATARYVGTNDSIRRLDAVIGHLDRSPGQYSDSLHADMDKVFQEVIKDLPVRSTSRLCNSATRKVVLLIGSTGTLGPYLLDSLLRDPTVATIYCLNRSDAEQRQKNLHASRDLSFNEARVHFLQGITTKPYMGLSTDVYKTLLSSVDNILYNAWPVNFNFPITQFVPHIHGVRSVVDFCAASSRDASIFFISSVGAITSWDQVDKNGTALPIPETPISDWASAGNLNTGYSASKLVVERLLDEAAKASGICAAVCRVGQIAGPVLSDKGYWPLQEWIPSMLALSNLMHRIPGNMGRFQKIEWIPVDHLAPVIVELMQSASNNRETGKLSVYHGINPRSATWSSIVPALMKYMPPDTDIVELKQWYVTLVTSAPSLPPRSRGLKLVPFFENLTKIGPERPTLELEKTLKASPKLAQLRAVSPEWMDHWCMQWKREGLFEQRT